MNGDENSLDVLMALEAARTDRDLPYMPSPSRSELVTTSLTPPLHAAPTAFVLPYLGDGSLVLAVNRRRGPETPGGHREEGETLEEAALREAYEETGCVVDGLVMLGVQRHVCEGPMPEGYRYPFPVSFQTFFAGRGAYRRGTHRRQRLE